ncbi:hypothetical protein CTI12_AA224550 [Artemisia annua]|uniref:Uncharacterized protein n=1 Tax=Artemisia annua TaxID=35608 RepID=A0A2U1NVC6_ARTAN|nr:hypothetical protein CTI12_AA224550 [Artemisia annua]
MASTDPSMISDPEEQKWVGEIEEILNHLLEINVETPHVSVFQLPETITTKKPEAYAPQQVGLGPIHHFRPQTYKKMEQKKLDVLRKVLQDNEIKDYKLIVLDKVGKLVPIVRSCYDMFLQGDDDSLAWIFTIDGLFLLNLLHSYGHVMDAEEEVYQRILKREKEEEYRRLLEMEKEEEYQRLLERKRKDEYQAVIKFMESQKLNSENITEEKMEPDDLPSLISSQKEEIVVYSVDKSIEIIEESDDFLRQKDFSWTSENQIDQTEHIIDLPPQRKQRQVFPARGLLAQDREAVQDQIPQELFNNFPAPQQKTVKVDLRRRLLAQDIMMVENQIPLMVLKEINGALHQSSGSNSSQSANTFSSSIFRFFCENHSPLKLCPASKAPTSVDHLLHYMYYSIVNNLPVQESLRTNQSTTKENSTGKVFDFVMKLPTKEIVQVYEQTISALETFTQSKILIPSASKLHDRAGFNFSYTGLQKVRMERNYIYLPCLTLNSDSEVILRNLIAYEALINNSNNYSPFTEYMVLMCALIMNVEDAKYLRKKDVIKGELENDEVVKLFTGMSNSITMKKTKEKSKLQEMIDEVNKVYEKGLRMKLHLLLKKLARWLLVGLRAIGGFVERSWKIVAFMVSIVAVFMLTWKAYCDVFGCDTSTVTLLPYASS